MTYQPEHIPGGMAEHTARHMRRMGPLPFRTPVRQLYDTLRAKAAEQGLALYRYCEHGPAGFISRVTYALHPIAAAEPTLPDMCSGPRAVLTCREGTTPRCQAYKELSNLLTYLH